ncbi:MAG: mechanosensitive ion channel [Candidatus Eisenbacteria bacterium]|nr:mechanosensitive ion channel [Candidatus Eisenbacteria bacterium]
MEQSFTIKGAVIQVLQQLGDGAVAFAPRLITAAILTLIGWLVASLCRFALSQVMQRAGADAALAKAGLMDSFERLGVREPMRLVLPAMLFWLTMLVFLQSAAEMVGQTTIAAGITGFFAFLPNLFSAMIIVVLGNALGQFLGRAATAYARESGVAFANSLGSALSGFTLFVVAIVALGQLEVDTRILNILTIVIFSGLALAFGLSFGLGTRDTTRNLIAGFYARRVFGAGQDLEVGGRQGKVRAISAQQTLIEQDGGIFAVPNTTLIEQVIVRKEEGGSAA